MFRVEVGSARTPSSFAIGLVLLLPAVLVACEGGGEEQASAGGAESVSTVQTPPRGHAAIEPWLAAGHFKQWTCEQMISPPRLGGLHGPQRICSNALLLGSQTDSYPVGAASVKELHDIMGRPNGFAVGLKIEPGPGSDTWYWYERTGRLATFTPKADGVGDAGCVGCHSSARRDYVFIRAQ